MAVAKRENVSREIDAGLLHARKLEDKARPTGENIYRGSAAGRCPRSIWASNHGLEPDEGAGFGAQVLRAFWAGKALEGPIVELLRGAGFIITDEQREVGEGNIRGHIDGIVRAPWNAHAVLLEIKTASPARFEKLQECPGGYSEWSPNYAAQVQTYLHFLPECASALVVVLDRGSLEIYAEEIFESASQWKVIEKGAEAACGDVMPPRPTGRGWTRSGPQCKFCDFQGACWDGAWELDRHEGPPE